MQKVLKKILAFGLALALCFGITATAVIAVQPILTDAAGDYYAPITATGGNSLLGQLHDLITTTHTKYTTYSNCRDYAPTTDPGQDGKGILEFYTHETVLTFVGSTGKSGYWNREHVWAQSLSNGLWGTSGGGSDMHHIRPTELFMNEKRGNNKYGNVTNGQAVYSKNTSGANSQLGGYLGGGTFEPLDNVKGDVARIVMYVYTHYNTYGNVYGTTNGSGSNFGTLNFTNIISASNEAAARQLLLEWNKLDPVDEIEEYRNETVYKMQGNRNPFIDHPEYADAIWGNVVTPDPSKELKSISIEPTSLKLYEGRSEKLTITPNPAGATASVNWTSSNEAIVTVSAGGEVTALTVGTATVTATSKTNASIKATAQVTVEKSNTKFITITVNSFTVTGNYGFHPWTAGGLSGTAFIYGGNSDSMQFNKSQSSYYLASSSEATGGIKSVTVKSHEGTVDREWKLLTSDKPYGEVSEKPVNGNDHGTKTVTPMGTTWTLSGSDTYFALTYEFTGDKGAAYLDSIVIEYGEEGQGSGGHTKLNEFHDAVDAIVTGDALEASFASINRAIAAYQALSEEEKALAKKDVDVLRTAIADYKQTAYSYNAEAEDANRAALNGAGSFFEWVNAFILNIMNAIWSK